MVSHTANRAAKTDPRQRGHGLPWHEYQPHRQRAEDCNGNHPAGHAAADRQPRVGRQRRDLRRADDKRGLRQAVRGQRPCRTPAPPRCAAARALPGPLAAVDPRRSCPRARRSAAAAGCPANPRSATGCRQTGRSPAECLFPRSRCRRPARRGTQRGYVQSAPNRLRTMDALRLSCRMHST